MNEIREANPVRTEVITHLRRVAEVKPIRMDDKRHGGIHGLSIESMLYLINNGVIPGSSTDRGRFRRGDIAFFHTDQLSELAAIHISEVNKPEESMSAVRTYAEMVSLEHGLLTEFGFSIGDNDATSAVQYLISDYNSDEDPAEMSELTDFFTQRGVSIDQIKAAIAKNNQRKGFLVAFSPDIQNDPELSFDGGDITIGEKDLTVKTGIKGLPYRYISGIQPLGPVEEEFLKKLLVSS